MAGLEIRSSMDADLRAWVAVTGEVDLATAPDLLDAILVTHQGDWRDVTVDLADVTFMDARGVATLVLAQRRLATLGRRLRIANARGPVAHVLDLSGVTAYLDRQDQVLPA